MADTAILAAGGDDAPLSYLVPGLAVIRIKQIHVKYVDDGAGVDWLPAVRVVNDSGHRMGTAADQAVKVTAGSDADVSFFPGVKHAPTTAGGGAAIAGIAQGWFNNPTFGDPEVTVNAGATIDLPFANTYVSDATLFAWATTTNPNDTLLLQSSTHFYMIDASARWDNTGYTVQDSLALSGPALVGGILRGNQLPGLQSGAEAFTINSGIGLNTTRSFGWQWPNAAGVGQFYQVQNNDVSNRKIAIGQMIALAFTIAAP